MHVNYRAQLKLRAQARSTTIKSYSQPMRNDVLTRHPTKGLFTFL